MTTIHPDPYTKRRTLAAGLTVCAACFVVFIGILACGGKPVLTNLTARELYERGMVEYEKEKFYKSVEYFQTLVFNYAGASVIDTAQYYLAMSYFGDEDWELARVEFSRLVTNYPASDFAVAAQFMRAVCSYQAAPGDSHRDQTDLDEALADLEDFIIDYPESDFIGEAQTLLTEGRGRLAKKDYQSGVVYLRIRAFAAAKIYFQKVVDDYTETKYGPLAAFGIAEADYKLKKYTEASQQFSRFTTVFSDHELSPKALEYEITSAFKAAEQDIKKGDVVAAREKLQLFLESYPEHEKSAAARKLLNELPEQSADSTTVSHAQGES